MRVSAWLVATGLPVLIINREWLRNVVAVASMKTLMTNIDPTEPDHVLGTSFLRPRAKTNRLWHRSGGLGRSSGFRQPFIILSDLIRRASIPRAGPML